MLISSSAGRASGFLHNTNPSPIALWLVVVKDSP